MKQFTTVFSTLWLVVFGVAIAATPPELLNYQGVLRAADGTPVTGAQEMRFALFTAASGGDEILVDQHLAAGTGAVPVDAGLFSVSIGGGAIVDGAGPGTHTSLAGVFRENSQVFVEIRIGGEVLAPRLRARSAAFALNSSYLEGKNMADITNDQVALIGAHAGDAAAHHSRYADAEAVVAMGAKSDANPLNHDRLTDGEIAAAASTGGLAGGDANGFEITDEWGMVWDGIERPAGSWADAAAKCSSLGGRLPTVTELWRNNATSGTGNIAGNSATNFIWTALGSSVAGSRMTTRLSDGTSTRDVETDSNAYRCAWPAVTPTVFDDNACHGAPGAPCDTLGFRWNVDSEFRAPVEFDAAMEECRLAGGTLPTLRQMEMLIHAGAENANLFRWASNFVFNSGSFVAIVRWNGPGEDAWAYDSFSSWTSTSASFGYRCIGVRPDLPHFAPLNPPCSGGCYSTEIGGAILTADSLDRAIDNHAQASEVCRGLGASLPRLGEVAGLVESGWDSGTNNFLWSAEPTVSSGTRLLYMYRWSGTGNTDWGPTTNGSVTQATSSLGYRCVWRSTLEEAPTVCAANEQQDWDGLQFNCTASTDGSSGGQAIPVEFLDAWGNAWDIIKRSSDTYANADADCQGLGGRLPTPTEIWRVRNGNGLVPAVGDASDVTFTWTSAPASTSAIRTTIRVSDGVTTQLSETSSTQYRCIWPGTSGSVLSGRQCYADPAESCFQSDRLRIDRLDRPAVLHAAAAFDCEQSGGRLPIFDELQELIHAGAPDGSNDFLWITNPIAVTATRFLALGRWAGIGTATWSFTSTDASFATSTTQQHFRCVFGDRID